MSEHFVKCPVVLGNTRIEKPSDSEVRALISLFVGRANQVGTGIRWTIPVNACCTAWVSWDCANRKVKLE